MTPLEYIGATVVGLFGLAICIIALEIGGNVYGGIKGAYRLRAIRTRYGGKRWPHWATIKLGLKAWAGKRYRNGLGHSWTVGGMNVPVDGRDPIERDRFFGA